MIDANDFFRQVTLLIGSSLEIEVAMPRCLAYLGRFMPADEMYLSLYESGYGLMRTIARAGAGGGEILEQAIPVPPRARQTIDLDLSKKIQIINRVNDHPVGSAIAPFLQQSSSSTLILHLDIEGRRMGEMVLIAHGRDRYTAEQAALLAQVAEPFALAMSNALKHRELIELKEALADDNRYLHQELRSLAGNRIVGADFGLKEVAALVRQVAPLNNPVLLLGETGTGKEVIANAIHFSSPRKQGPLIKVNCGAIPETLLDSELFGHEKGAFTGALERKRGRFERAHQGTIFLDEIGELPQQAQVRLLRVIQHKEIERVGGSDPLPLDIRIITATNRNLAAMVAAGSFREDLWFRINVFPIIIPPLRHRKMDLPALVRHLVERKSKELGRHELPRLAPGALDRLMAYDWPGNVRELENVVERALVLCRDDTLDFENIATPDLPAPPRTAAPTFERLDALCARHIRHALDLSAGRVHGPQGAAALLGLNPSTLRHRMHKLGIPFGRGTHDQTMP